MSSRAVVVLIVSYSVVFTRICGPTMQTDHHERAYFSLSRSIESPEGCFPDDDYRYWIARTCGGESRTARTVVAELVLVFAGSCSRAPEKAAATGMAEKTRQDNMTLGVAVCPRFQSLDLTTKKLGYRDPGVACNRNHTLAELPLDNIRFRNRSLKHTAHEEAVCLAPHHFPFLIRTVSRSGSRGHWKCTCCTRASGARSMEEVRFRRVFRYRRFAQRSTHQTQPPSEISSRLKELTKSQTSSIEKTLVAKNPQPPQQTCARTPL